MIIEPKKCRNADEFTRKCADGWINYLSRRGLNPEIAARLKRIYVSDVGAILKKGKDNAQ